MFTKRLKSFAIKMVMVIAFFSVFYIFFIDRDKEDNSLLNNQNNVKIQEETLKPDVNYENFITSVQNDTKIVLLTVNGRYLLTHDKTKQSNAILEWFSISKIELNCDYSVCFVIQTNGLQFSKESNGLKVSFSEEDIYINSLTITNPSASEVRALFGKRYGTSELLALENILKEQILEESYKASNLQQAKVNLEAYLYDIANSFGVSIEVCEK